MLKPFSEMHKRFLESQEDTTDDVIGYYAEYIQSVGNVKIYQTGGLISVINAYHKDISSIVGIVRKVLNN